MLLAGEQVWVGGGLATALPTVDFETYSEAGYDWDGERQRWRSLPGLAEQNRGIGAVGAYNYINHPSFDVLSVSWDLLNGEGVKSTWLDAFLDPDDLLEHVRRGGIISGWNGGGFEWRVWNHFCVPRWGWPVLDIRQVRCDMAKSRHFAYPGALAKAGEVMQLREQKDKRGTDLIRRFTMPRNPTKKDSRTRIEPEHDPEGPTFLAYNAQDVRAETEASLRCPDLPPEEQEIWFTDQAINQRGIQVDMVAVENCISILEQAEAKYNAELRQLTQLPDIEHTEVARLKEWLSGQGYFMPSLDDDAIGALLKRLDDSVTSGHNHPDEIKRVWRVLEIRRMLGSASVRKLFAFRCQSAAGRLYDLYTYFGARTGRWTAQGPQPQNLPIPDFKSIEEVERALKCISYRVLELVEAEYGNAIDCIVNVLRSLLIAAPGHQLVCSDFSAIEAVITACLTGEQWRIDVFRTHGKIYEASIAKSTRTPLDEILNYRKVHGKHHPLRQRGKRQELACGYQGWVGGWKKINKDDHDDERIKSDILTWRRESPMIVMGWGGQSVGEWEDKRPLLFGLEGAMVAAIKDPGRAYSYRGIVYQMEGDLLICQVPDGGRIHYHRPRLTRSERPYAAPWEYQISYEGWNSNPQTGPIGWLRMFIYGGKCLENVVQKIGRTYQSRALVSLEKAGYRPVLHSHDEIAGEVPTGRITTSTVAEFEALMSACPHPAYADWPVKAKGGWVNPRYGKFED